MLPLGMLISRATRFWVEDKEGFGRFFTPVEERHGNRALYIY